MQDVFKGFREPNQGAEGESLVRFLDGSDKLDFVQEYRSRMLDLCPVHDGDHVLDIGCGAGHEVRRLAERVGWNGRVVGIDQGESTIAEAKRRATGQSLPVEFLVADAGQLDFTSHSFNLCRAERVLLFVEDPRRVLNEMVRVVRPGGFVVIFDFDHDGFVLDVPDQSLFHRIKELYIHAVPNGAIGRQLPRLMREAGLLDIRVVPQVLTVRYARWRYLVEGTLAKAVEMGTISADELERWWSELDTANQENRFFGASLGFIVAGRKP